MIKINLVPGYNGPFVTHNGEPLDNRIELTCNKRYEGLKTIVFDGSDIIVEQDGNYTTLTTDIKHSLKLVEIFDTKLLSSNILKDENFMVVL